MDKILITGGTSFVGYWLKVTRPENVIAYSIGRERYDGMKWFDHKWDGIIHAGLVSPAKVLERARLDKCRVLYVSSGVVYHPEFEPKYRQIKLDGEKECLDSGQDVVIARLFTFCGERLDDKKAITTFYKAARENKPLIITGDGNTIRSYMHGSLMAEWLWALLKRGKSGEAYDIGSDTPITMLGLAKEIIEETGSQSEIVIQNGKDPMTVYLPPNTAKTKRIVYGDNIQNVQNLQRNKI